MCRTTSICVLCDIEVRAASTGEIVEPSRAAGNFALHPNGNLLANTENGSLRLWQLRGDVWADVELGDPQPSTPTGTVSFSPDGRRLVEVGAKGSLVVWDLDPNS